MFVSPLDDWMCLAWLFDRKVASVAGSPKPPVLWQPSQAMAAPWFHAGAAAAFVPFSGAAFEWQ